jgi:hypothetical protein
VRAARRRNRSSLRVLQKLTFHCARRSEPVEQAVSMYRRFAMPRASADSFARAAAHPPPALPEWLAMKHDPQTRALLGFNVRAAEIGGVPFTTCTQGAQERALQNLKRAFTTAAALWIGRATDAMPQALTWLAWWSMLTTLSLLSLSAPAGVRRLRTHWRASWILRATR